MMKNSIRESMCSQPATKCHGGFTLLDVVLGIAVFALGMLALVQLQGSLARSGADANQRTVAANIAEELVEELRGYRSIIADPDNGLWDYLEMQGNALDDTVTRGNIEYTRTVTVSNFWWNPENEEFERTTTAEPPADLDYLVLPDFKLLRLDVSWGNSEDFYVSDAQTADMNTGNITIYEIIPSSPPILGAELASTLDDDSGPIVVYDPGDNPDIIALKLDDSNTRFKESTSAAPKLFRENKEAWFDVITYSQVADDAAAEFLRREQFLAVSCQCQLDEAPAEADWGMTPTMWNGITYSDPQKVSKPIGINNPPPGGQSPFCEICCRDHHDIAGGSEEEVYLRSNAGGGGDHPHYGRDSQGNLVGPVSDGETYIEACRLIRKDGFLQVTQDASQKTLIAFPEGYLEFNAGAANYSAYAISAIEDYYAGDQTDFADPIPGGGDSWTEFPAREGGLTGSATQLPSATLGTSQQLRARSIYADYLTEAAATVISDCFPASGNPSPSCASDASSEMEIYPFFDLQMTYLADWVDDLSGLIIPASDSDSRLNQPIVDYDFDVGMPGYDRGIAELNSEVGGQVDITITSEDGNPGLLGESGIRPSYVNNEEHIFININGLSSEPPPVGDLVSGALRSSVRRVDTSQLIFESPDALCGKTADAWSCVVESSGGSLTVSGYYLNNPTVYVCSDPVMPRIETADSTTFTLPISGGTYDLIVTDDPTACPG